MIMWDTITVGQFQDINQALLDYKDNPDDLEFQVMCACTGMTEAQLDRLEMQEYLELKRKYAFLNDPEQTLLPKAVKHVTTKTRRYKFIYDVRKIRAHRYIEGKILEGRGVVPNLHYIAASMSVPMKKTILGWKEEEYDMSRYDEYAEELRRCPVSAIYGSVVFFCNVFVQSMISLKGFLIKEMRKTMSETDAQSAYTHLCNSMVGITKLLSLPNTNESHSTQPINYQ